MGHDINQILSTAEQQFTDALFVVNKSCKVPTGNIISILPDGTLETVVRVTPTFVFLQSENGKIRKITKTRLNREFNIDVEG
jgi:hypothetical protein